MDYVKLALPKGELLKFTSCFLDEIGLGFEKYSQDTRLYHLESKKQIGLTAKIFQERDIPVQVAVGNYDMGICGLDWIEEMLARYPGSPIIKMADLEYDKGYLYLASSAYGCIKQIQDIISKAENWKIVSEYPNLSENCALNLRLKKFKIIPVYGTAEAYPPEDADMVIIKVNDEKRLSSERLVPLKMLLHTKATLIINKISWQTKNMGVLIGSFSRGIKMKNKPWLKIEPSRSFSSNEKYYQIDKGTVRLALPDGHQSIPASNFLKKCGIDLTGYQKERLVRRPSSNFPWLKIKVIRPQDMPLQVANGNFDLAVTGKDWFLDHMFQFPSSPLIKLLDLGFGTVSLIAAVSQDIGINDISGLKLLMEEGRYIPLRTASEYQNIAENYLHNNHIKRYRLIPTSGASETLIPDDADLLIDNTETGETLKAHKLKIVDTLFKSSAFLIGNKNNVKLQEKKDRIKFLLAKFKTGLAQK